jgi:8-oxo-dGTP diphosphatase
LQSFSFLDCSGFKVNLTFNPTLFLEPTDVLILPFYQGSLIMTKHKKRGIELPGGKIKGDETPLAAAVREVYEECGARLSSIKLVGQYSIPEFNKVGLIKNIYLANVSQLDANEFCTDTLGPVIFDEIPTDVSKNEFSPYIQDNVYPLTMEYLHTNMLINEGK